MYHNINDVQRYDCWILLAYEISSFCSGPGHNPPESIGSQGSRHIVQGLASDQMAIPAGEGEVWCQALVHFSVAIRFHGRQQCGLLTWQGDTAKDAGLVHWSSRTCVADVNKKTMPENFSRKGSFSLRFAVPCQRRHHVYLLSGKAISDQVSLPRGSGTYIQEYGCLVWAGCLLFLYGNWFLEAAPNAAKCGGIGIQDQDDTLTGLQGKVERRFARIVRNVILHIMLIVRICAHPVKRIQQADCLMSL